MSSVTAAPEPRAQLVVRRPSTLSAFALAAGELVQADVAAASVEQFDVAWADAVVCDPVRGADPALHDAIEHVLHLLDPDARPRAIANLRARYAKAILHDLAQRPRVERYDVDALWARYVWLVAAIRRLGRVVDVDVDQAMPTGRRDVRVHLVTVDLIEALQHDAAGAS